MYDFRAQYPEFDWSKYPTPKRSPFIVFIVTRNPKDPEHSYKEPWVFDLDHTAGTYDHVLRYQLKGYEPIAYGNLLPENPQIGVTGTSDSMGDEHVKIKAHIDQILRYKVELFAKAKAEFDTVAEDERKTIEARVEAEVQKRMAALLAEELAKREAEKQAEKAVAAELAQLEADKAANAEPVKVEAEKPAEPKAEAKKADKK